MKEGGSYSGTGDLFASVLSAGMVKGMDTVDSVRKAVKFLSKGIPRPQYLKAPTGMKNLF